jgi:environmental stress-induced protein Ves
MIHHRLISSASFRSMCWKNGGGDRTLALRANEPDSRVRVAAVLPR